MRTSAVVLVGGLSLFGCTKSGSGAALAPAAAPAPNATSGTATAEFDKKWAALSAKDQDAFYVEDDRGEGLMGNVRRARHEEPPAAAAEKTDPMGPQENLTPQAIQQVIKQNLPGVKACYLRISREGEQRSGKAIVSFGVGPAGDVHDTKVDAPSFEGTTLPTCVSGMVSHWAFPKSHNGGPPISYPFVFVGG
jgi:hypothetical protein